VGCRAGRAPARPYGNSRVWGFDGSAGAMDLRLCFFVFFSQQEQQEEEEVLVPHGPHQELPNGAQPMEGLVGPSRLATSSVCP
jgi:hypothetical protein